MMEITVFTARRANGRYLACSKGSPFLCVEGETEAAALQQVDAALVFYDEAKGKSTTYRVVAAIVKEG